VKRAIALLAVVVAGVALALAPSDRYYASHQWWVARVNLPAAWDTTLGAGVTVALVDTGFVPHPDLTGRWVAGWDFVSNDADPTDVTPRTGSIAAVFHGTFIAGLLAANHDTFGIAGVAPRARVSPVRVFSGAVSTVEARSNGILWAAGAGVSGVPTNPNPAKVINLSYTGSLGP
jgi:serine protease